jgi:hypothetical protein
MRGKRVCRLHGGKGGGPKGELFRKDWRLRLRLDVGHRGARVGPWLPEIPETRCRSERRSLRSERGSDTAAISDDPGSNHRDTHGSDDLRNECHGANQSHDRLR